MKAYWYVDEEILSDGSKIYDVVFNTRRTYVRIHVVDRRNARRLCKLLNDKTVGHEVSAS